MVRSENQQFQTALLGFQEKGDLLIQHREHTHLSIAGIQPIESLVPTHDSGLETRGPASL